MHKAVIVQAPPLFPERWTRPSAQLPVQVRLSVLPTCSGIYLPRLHLLAKPADNPVKTQALEDGEKSATQP